MKRMLKIWSWLCALLLLLPLHAAAEELTRLYLERSGQNDYAAYLASLTGMEAVGEAVGLYESAEGVPLAEGDRLSFTVSIPEDVFGYPVLTYAMTGSNILDNGFTLLVDGEVPYAECSTLTLDSLWIQSGVFSKDRYGNEVVSMPVKSYETTSCYLMGKAGMYSKGMGLYLPAGGHEITIICREGPFRLYSMTLERGIPVLEAAQGTPRGNALITLQAEQVPVRNNPNIRPLADYDMHLTPYSSDRKVINHIEDTSYKYLGDALTYTFHVEQAGHYAMALRLRQSELANFPVYRTVLVDGVIPGPAFENAEFGYSLQFENQTIMDAEGKPAYLYLTEGDHTLTLLTSVDPLRPSLQLLQVISDEMADLSLQITKITGGNTDFFRDFALEDFDFHIVEDLNRWIGELTAVRAELGRIAGAEGRVGALSSLDMAIQALEQLAREPDNLPKKLALFSQGSSSARGFLVSTVENLSTSPVGLDAIYMYTDEALLPREPNFLEQAADTVSRFIASFTDESYVADNADESKLQVWVNRPRQYLEILQRMADATFTPRTGVEVEFSIMPDESKLILANASGAAPDVALGVSTTRVYDLAVRGALKNLREYEDFAAVGKWFPAGLLMPAVCDDGMYALPETFNFYVLFYRKDILESIGLEVPNSYEEVLKMLPALHRFGLNCNSFVANAVGYKAFSITTPFLYQNGAVLYEDGDLHVQLDTEEAIEAVKVMTDSFVIYDMDFEVNSFYQSFRDGTLPIGTSNYAMYNLVMNAAPELADKWGIALYPGLTDENGQVQRWTSGMEQSCFIFDNTNMPEEAWQFLSWWMSEEIQTEFAFTLQSTLGNEYMWNSANVDAYLNAPWPTEHKKIIAEQMNWICETPRNTGSYMVERELSNAVNAVCLEGSNLRAALDEAIKRIDRELERKLEEFGRMKDGQLTEPFIVPGKGDAVGRYTQPRDHTLMINSVFGDPFTGLGHSANFYGPDLDSIYTSYHCHAPEQIRHELTRWYCVDRLLTNGGWLYTTGPSDTAMPVPNQPDVKGDARGDLRDFVDTAEGYFAEVSASSRFTQECSFILHGGEMAWRMGSREGKPALITTDGKKLYFTADGKILAKANVPELGEEGRIHTLRVECTEDVLYVYIDAMRLLRVEKPDITADTIGALKRNGAAYSFMAHTAKALGDGDLTAVKAIPGRFAAVHAVNGATMEKVEGPELEAQAALLGTATYNVRVAAERAYCFDLTVRARDAGKQLTLRLDEKPLKTIVIPAGPEGEDWFTFTTDAVWLPAGDHALGLQGDDAALLTISSFAHEGMEEKTWALEQNKRDGVITLGQFAARNGALSIGTGKNSFALIGGQGCTDYELCVTFDMPRQGGGFSGFLMHATHPSIHPDQVAEACYGYGIAITGTGLTIRRMNYGHAMEADKIKIDGWKNLTSATLRLRMEKNVLSVFVGDAQEPAAVIHNSAPFTHGMCGLFSTGRELRVTEMSVRPLQ